MKNIAEILKNCPKGMELDCAMWDSVQLKAVMIGNIYPIKIQTPEGIISLTKNGCYSINPHCKCVIFPKGKTTWEGFVPPCKFKDGDVIYIQSSYEYIAIYKKTNCNNLYKYTAICISFNNRILQNNDALCCEKDVKQIRLATKEEKQKLFDAIKANGYKWNAETKTLEKLIKPKFKVGDRVKQMSAHTVGIVVKVDDKGYYIDYPKLEGVCFISFMLEKDYELLPNKFDITTLKPFDKVLVRYNKDNKWCCSFFSHIDKEHCSHCYKYVTTAGKSYPYCIPYEGNRHLRGTTDDCNDFYKTWE